jgi:long-chain acyl-CoA synthetase
VDEADTLQALLQRLSQWGEAAAIIAFPGAGMEETSFAALIARARALARALARRGIGPGAAVALIAPAGPAWVTAFWAVAATGAVAVAIDAQIGDDEARHMLEITRCRLVFTTAARGARLPPRCEAIAIDEDLPSAPEDGTAFKPVGAADVAVILFTSGTTGTPKAVPLTHANLLSNVAALSATRIARAGDRALLPLPMHHAYAITVAMLTGFACGVALVFAAGVSGPELLDAMRRARATVLLGVPRLYTALLAGIRQRVASQPKWARRVFALMLALAIRMKRFFGASPSCLLFGAIHRQLAPDLRLLVSGGAKLEIEVEEILGALGWEVMTGYGLTETSPILAFNSPRAVRPGSAGRALPGVALRIVNADAQGVGEIEAKGASVFQGYLGDAAATQRAFTADGWFRTGDLGRIDGDGYLFIIARATETIVLAGGEKLFPEALEAVYGEHPLIKEIAVLGLDGALVALVVPDLDALRAEGAVRMKDMIRDALAERGRLLPSHARLTGFAVARDKLPRTQLGKIRRHLVPALYADALRAHEGAGPAELSAEDKTLLAAPTAAAVWAFLRVRFPDRALGLDMSPQLDLGIDSLGWVDLTLALERDLGVRFTEQEIGRIVTLRDLLREAGAAAARPPAESAPQQVSLPQVGVVLRLVHDLGAALIRATMRIAFHLKVEGRDNLPEAGPCLICPNHESYLDPFAVVAALPPRFLRQTWWAGWTGILYTTRARRLFSRAAQIVPVDQYRGGGASLALAAEVFARRSALVWFPEGGRSHDGTLQPFQAGIGVLVERHKVPIFPVAIEGSFEAWPVSERRPRCHPIRVRFGKAIDPLPLVAAPEATPQRIADAVHDAVATLARGD